MPAYLGTKKLQKAFVGTDKVQRIYIGGDLAWQGKTKPIVVGAAISDNTTITIPSHQAGDLILMWAYRSTNLTLPTIPSAGGTVPTWTQILQNQGNSQACRVCYAIASSSSTTSGTWTNGRLACIVLRGVNPSDPIGANNVMNGTNSQAASIAPAVSMENPDGTSALIHMFGSFGAIQWGDPPSGYTKHAGATNFTCIISKNDTTSDGQVSMPHMVTPLANYIGVTVEILPA